MESKLLDWDYNSYTCVPFLFLILHSEVGSYKVINMSSRDENGDQAETPLLFFRWFILCALIVMIIFGFITEQKPRISRESMYFYTFVLILLGTPIIANDFKCHEDIDIFWRNKWIKENTHPCIAMSFLAGSIICGIIYLPYLIGYLVIWKAIILGCFGGCFRAIGNLCKKI